MKGKKISKKIWIAIVAVFLAIAIAVTSIVLVRKRNNENANDNNYVMLDSGFTNVKVKDEKTALKAIGSVASTLGITDVNKELQSVRKDTIDTDTFYKFQQYHNGIPVYGKTVTLMADKKGRAQTLVSNVESLDSVASKYEGITVEEKNAVYFDDHLCSMDYVEHEDGTYLRFTDVKSEDMVEELCQTYTADYAEPTEEGNVLLFDSRRNIKGINVHKKETRCNFIGSGTTFNKTLYFGKQLTNEEVQKKNDKARISEKTTLYRSEKANTFNNIFSDNIEFLTAKSESNLDQRAVDIMKKVATTNDYFDNVLKRKGFDGHQSRLYIAYNDGLDSGTNSRSNIGNQLGFGYKENMSVDLVAHEYMHSVEFTISGMNYKGESGALMEAYSDVFGELVEAYANDADPDWIHKTYSSARNMASPGKNKNPDTYKGENWKSTVAEYDKNGRTTNDHGSVHNNSTVFSRAAYLMWHGISDVDERKIDCDSLAKIWYRSLFLLPHDATFEEAAKAVYQSASTLGTLTRAQLDCVRRAFADVGIKNSDYPTDYVVGPGAQLSVLDLNLNPLTSYCLEIRTGDSREIVFDGTITSDSPYIIDLLSGKDYIFIIKDNKKSRKEYKYHVMVVKNGNKTPLVLRTIIDPSSKEIEYTPVASMTGWVGPEHFQWDYDYDYSSKRINATKQYLEPTGDWGDGYPVEYISPIDGLVWDGILRDNPVLAMTFNCTDGFVDELLLAYHPKVLTGDVSQIEVKGIGKVEFAYVDVETKDFFYSEKYYLKVNNGHLEESVKELKYTQDEKPSKYITKYTYDSQGRLSGYKKVLDYNDGTVSDDGTVTISYNGSNIIHVDYSGLIDRSWDATLDGNQIRNLHFKEEWQSGPEECDITMKYDSNGNLVKVKGSIGIYGGSGEDITYDSMDRISSFFPNAGTPSHSSKDEFFYSKKKPSIKHRTTTTTAKPPVLNENGLFKSIPTKYVFSSGAGAWRTYLQLSLDGSFIGQFTDSEANVMDDDYELGTVYICNFKGKFSKPVRQTDYSYSIKLERLSMEDHAGDEYTKNGQHFIVMDSPYGMENTDTFTVYVPGYPTDLLPEDLSLLFGETRLPDNTYLIYNPSENAAFINTDEVEMM